MSQDGGSGYRTYVFEESTRRCAIDRKGRGRKEVIYLDPDLLPKFYHRAKPHQAKPSLEGLEPVRDFLVIRAG